MHWTLTNQLHHQFLYWIQARIRDHKSAFIKAQPPPLLGVPNPRKLHIPRDPEPIVSIIVPTYGKPDLTLSCLASISKYLSATGIEIVVVDDASPGQAAETLCLVEGIKLIVNEKNQGFIRSCNLGAKVALGEFVLFLNNDTQVTDGWLEPMVRLFRDFQRVGAVGSKLLFPDGYLQEAGCIIWRDGTGWNLGRRKDPTDPKFNYVREVDYCSGASLMIPKILFDRVGGFDERYAPAYFEDVDLSFKLRAIGYRTLYQPRSVVVHIEGMSHGTDDEGPKSHYITHNRSIFVDHWRPVLRREQFVNGQNFFRARDRARHRRVILVVDHSVPKPDRDAGSRAMLNFLQAFLAHGLVVKFLPHDLSRTPGYTQTLEDLGIEVIGAPGTLRIDDWILAFGAELDAVVLSRPHVAESLLPLLRRLNIGPIIYYGHDIHFQRIAGEAMVRGSSQLEHEGSLMEARERGIWRNVDIVLYPTEEESQTVKQLEPRVVCYTITAYAFSTFPAPRSPPENSRILFVAGFAHPPNEDAAVWFVQEVMPMVRRSVPTVALTVIGSNPSARVTALVADDVTLLSNVSDTELIENYRSARVSVVPLRYGAGIKLKTVEALREGLPLVTTPVGAQGLPMLAEVASVCADKSGFGREVCRLLVDDLLWLDRCAGQIEYAKTHFTNRALQETVSHVLVAANLL